MASVDLYQPSPSTIRPPSIVAKELAEERNIELSRASYLIREFIRKGSVGLWQRPGPHQPWTATDADIVSRRPLDVLNDRLEREPTKSHEDASLTKAPPANLTPQERELWEFQQTQSDPTDEASERLFPPPMLGLRLHDVRTAYEQFLGAHKNKGGRPAKYDWTGAILAALSKIGEEGWRPKNQADIERFLLDWSYEQHQDEPDDSLCEKPAKAIFRALAVFARQSG